MNAHETIGKEWVDTYTDYVEAINKYNDAKTWFKQMTALRNNREYKPDAESEPTPENQSSCKDLVPYVYDIEEGLTNLAALDLGVVHDEDDEPATEDSVDSKTLKRRIILATHPDRVKDETLNSVACLANEYAKCRGTLRICYAAVMMLAGHTKRYNKTSIKRVKRDTNLHRTVAAQYKTPQYKAFIDAFMKQDYDLAVKAIRSGSVI